MSSMPARLSKQGADKALRVQLSLRVLSGMHTGAEIRLPDRGILMIGQADDCDLILSDDGIAAHHCVLTVVGDQVLMRAMEGEVSTHDGPVAIGENITLEHFAIAHLSQVQLAVGPHWSEHWQSLADAADHGGPTLTGSHLAGRRRGLLGVVALLLLVAVLVLFGSWKVNQPVAVVVHNNGQRLDQVQAILHQLSLRHVRASIGDDNRIQLRGVIGNPAQLPQLRNKLSAAGLDTVLTVRDWPSVAKQVQDIFAMHDYHVETQLQDDGSVMVNGHFGDRDAYAKMQKDVLGSGDMQRLDAESLGLRLGTKNFDETPEAPAKLDPGLQIKHVFSGPEGYLVTRDGSRYYPNSPLPQAHGGLFLGVAANDAVLVRMPNNSLVQLEKDDGYQTPRPIDDATAAAFVQPASAGTSAVPAASATTEGAHKP